MGVDAGDFDNNGDEDLIVTELTGQGADLFVNEGRGIFTDRSADSRLRFASLALDRIRNGVGSTSTTTAGSISSRSMAR